MYALLLITYSKSPQCKNLGSREQRPTVSVTVLMMLTENRIQLCICDLTFQTEYKTSFTVSDASIYMAEVSCSI